MARDPSTADGARPRPAISRASLTALAALAAASLAVADAAAAPAELPPWDPTGTHTSPAVPETPPASSPRPAPSRPGPPSPSQPGPSSPTSQPGSSPAPSQSSPGASASQPGPSSPASPPGPSSPASQSSPASPPGPSSPASQSSPGASASQSSPASQPGPSSPAPSRSSPAASASQPGPSSSGASASQPGSPAAATSDSPAPASATSPTAADPAAPPPASYSDELPQPPRDPNDTAFMRPPNNQFQGLPPRTRPDIRRGWSARRRFAFTVAPAFAQFRLPFQGGRPPRLPGAGVNLELDLQIWRWIWLRGHGTYSGHPVDDVRVMNSDMEVTQTAPRGTIHATGFGAGPAFALDLGRFLPLIEVGLGALRIASPHGEIKGQRGAACGDNRSCDVGLKCGASNVCEPSLLPDLYFGLAVDLLVRRHFSFGAQFRYYSRLARGQLTNFPVYLLGTIRLSVRF